MEKTNHFDVIIIGGSYAGMSAAMALGRALRTVLIIDSGKPCNAQTPHSHNFLTQDGNTPAEIAVAARHDLSNYQTITLKEDTAVKGHKTSSGFQIETSSGEQFSSRKLVFASGVKDILPVIPGAQECWGISLIHCPYCHGYEVRNEKTAILGNGDSGFEMARLISQWTKQLSILTNGLASFTPEQLQLLDRHAIGVMENKIATIDHENGYIRQVSFTDGGSWPVTAIYHRAAFEQHCPIPQQMGGELTEMGHIRVDPMQRTTIPGVYAVGDSVTPMRSVASAVHTGSFAGAALNREMIEEDFHLAL